ncbi:helix-turn-helix domain-containing protein [Maribacter confluentis]|uniref:Helix-turn-helix domain-containing protein n=1 Tax=Maribacter confluentis TaxID=1656093 RepID=A0ABT8RL42_9FLAO|nr:helix-turn-helix domain-containing protein [Maribacter confluentis]MDO1511645.1 helix-turn-helix domain-containing protein [Maribacter confluentis]
MSSPSSNKSIFIEQAEAIILENLANEQFGVSELAETMHMSRSNLLRKIKKQTKLSASQFIRQVRLKEAMVLLKEDTSTVSEISYQVGFGSTSYFIKCFREHYGYPPGEVGKNMVAIEEEKDQTNFLKRYRWPIIAAICGIVLTITFLLLNQQDALYNTVDKLEIERSIAVLPFKNESADSTNLYFVNGLMESALNNLQKIEDLRVISRTSVEKYRKTDKGIPEIANELNVNYLVEGSGQRVGNQVLLNIQLIEASSDTPIWVEQYNQEVVDIFALQNDVAKKIADAIEAVVTPAELEQIEKKPTQNLVAYDYYLQALDPFFSRTNQSLHQAIELFEKAIEEDAEFSMAYANIAISYYLLEMSQREKQYTEKINSYADKALLYDSKSAEGLVAKAFYYIQTKEYQLALPHLNKALEYNPNSSLAVQILADFHFRMIPNTSKYLEYALKGFHLNVASDSVTQSYTCLGLSNALISSGFIDEALKYVNMSLDYNAENYFAPHLKAFILFAKDGDVERTRNLVVKEWKKDTTRLDLLQDIGKLYYIEENYDKAYYYFEKFVNARKASGLSTYLQENVKIAQVYKKMGLDTEAERLFNDFSAYCEQDKSSYRSISLVWYYAYLGKVDEAIEQLRLFSEIENYIYWFLLIEDEPLIKPLKSHPEFESLMQKIKDRFWENQIKLKKTLEENELI